MQENPHTNTMSAAGTSKEMSHKCVFCNQAFPNKVDLQTHFRRHANGELDIKGQVKVMKKTNVKPIAKEDEGKLSKNRTKKVTSAVCDVCGEMFLTVSLAISHKFRKHPESVVKHYCPHCGMMFPIKINRDKHLLSHSGGVPKQLFPCLICGVGFYNFRARKFHMDSAHKGAIRMVNPIKTPAPSLKIVLNNAGETNSVYYCHLCGCEYQVKFNLQKHLSTRHTNEEREAIPGEVVQCNLCSAMFYSKKAYDTHNHHHRDTDLFATNEEMRQQIVQRIDQDYDEKRVPTTIERHLSAAAISSIRSATRRNIRAKKNKDTGQSLSEDETLDSPTSIEESVVKESNCGTKEVPSTTPAAVTLNSKEGERETQEEERSDTGICGLDDKNTSEVSTILGKAVSWKAEDGVSRKRMLDDGEEEKEVSRLGHVDPDTVMPNQRALRGQIVPQPNTHCGNSQVHRDDAEEELEVEKIVGMRQGPYGREFLVRWRGFEPADDTWEREEFLRWDGFVADFLHHRKLRTTLGKEMPIEWYEAPRRKVPKAKERQGDS